MKILRLIYDWPPPWAGLGPHPYELTAAQVNLGHSFDIFCGSWPSSGSPEQLPNTTIHSFVREPLPGTLNITTSVLMFFYYLFWRRTHEVDLVHSHGHFAIWVYLYRKLLKKYKSTATELKTPLVVHFHNTVAGREASLKEKGQTPKVYSQYIAWPLAKLADQWAVEVADACIFVSEDTKNEAIKYYNADPTKCYVVETGVNTQLFTKVLDEEKDKTRKEIGLDPLDKVILNHGVMVERKNIHLLVDALKFLPREYKLLLVGSGDNAYIEKLDEQVAELKLQNRVVRVGYTPYPQTPIAFQAADVFVLPSSFEGLPKVVMQSLSCGVPALVSGFQLSEELRGLYYLENLEPQTIANQIKEVIDYKVDVDVNKVRHLYSWHNRAHEVDRIYAQVTRV